MRLNNYLKKLGKYRWIFERYIEKRRSTYSTVHVMINSCQTIFNSWSTADPFIHDILSPPIFFLFPLSEVLFFNWTLFSTRTEIEIPEGQQRQALWKEKPALEINEKRGIFACLFVCCCKIMIEKYAIHKSKWNTDKLKTFSVTIPWFSVSVLNYDFFTFSRFKNFIHLINFWPFFSSFFSIFHIYGCAKDPLIFQPFLNEKEFQNMGKSLCATDYLEKEKKWLRTRNSSSSRNLSIENIKKRFGGESKTHRKWI